MTHDLKAHPETPTKSEYQRNRYARLIAEGKCCDCARDAKGNGTRCKGCAKLVCERKERRIASCMNQGICHKCGGRLEQGRRACVRCARDRTRKRRTAATKVYTCTLCGATGHQMTTCEKRYEDTACSAG